MLKFHKLNFIGFEVVGYKVCLVNDILTYKPNEENLQLELCDS